MKRNIERFPEDFCFQLSNKETNDLRCQNGTTKFLSSKRRYNPYVYTEEGVIALIYLLIQWWLVTQLGLLEKDSMMK